MSIGVKRLYSDDYNKATNAMFECLKMAAKYPVLHKRHEYWNNKAKEFKNYREKLKVTGKYKYVK